MAHSVEHKAPYRPSGEVRMLPPPTERICPPSHAGGGASHRTMLLGRRIHEHRRFRSRIRPLQRRPQSASRANPSVESVRGLIGRVPGPSFSNRRPPQLAPAEMNRRMSGLVRSLSGFPPSGARITVVMHAGDGEAERRHGSSMGPRSENRGYVSF